jgi:hypothetical protein
MGHQVCGFRAADVGIYNGIDPSTQETDESAGRETLRGEGCEAAGVVGRLLDFRPCRAHRVCSPNI